MYYFNYYSYYSLAIKFYYYHYYFYKPKHTFCNLHLNYQFIEEKETDVRKILETENKY